MYFTGGIMHFNIISILYIIYFILIKIKNKSYAQKKSRFNVENQQIKYKNPKGGFRYLVVNYETERY